MIAASAYNMISFLIMFFVFIFMQAGVFQAITTKMTLRGEIIVNRVDFGDDPVWYRNYITFVKQYWDTALFAIGNLDINEYFETLNSVEMYMLFWGILGNILIMLNLLIAIVSEAYD